MSCCRWSSDNWKCDLYCHRSSDGYITHVAGNRVKGDVPVVPAVYAVSSEEFSKADRAQMDVLKNADRIAIDLQQCRRDFY